ncbi:UNVERIFIED_CONTAM: hypothetical protein FKN15_045864 [Acipenser sinensis]
MLKTLKMSLMTAMQAARIKALIPAVCCADNESCCPEGTTCDTEHKKCVSAEGETTMRKKFPAMKKNSNNGKMLVIVNGTVERDVKCDDTKSCPDGNTCCKNKQGGWGCCSFPKVASKRDVADWLGSETWFQWQSGGAHRADHTDRLWTVTRTGSKPRRSGAGSDLRRSRAGSDPRRNRAGSDPQQSRAGSDPQRSRASSDPRRSRAGSDPRTGELFTTPTPVSPVWEGEAVTLQCGAHINKQGTQLQYHYSKGNGNVRGDGSQDQHSIPVAGLRDTGRYQCEVEAAGTGLKKRSDSVWLTVRELFSTPTLTVLPGASVWEGEAVTLQCGAHINKQDTQLQYCYSKNNGNVRGAGSRDPYGIQCEVEAAGTGLKKRSGSVSLTVRAGRNAPVTQDYYSRIDGDRYTISSATGDHSGEYTCKGERTGNPSYSKTSNALTLKVSVDNPKPVQTGEPAGEIFEGDTVTLSCVVEGGSGGWRYLWYKDRQGAPVYQTDSSSGTGAGYTISAAALSHSGEYWCGARRGSNLFNSEYSNAVKIQVSELFSTPTLTVLPAASVWKGEAVTLQCGAHINKQGTQLQYRYSKDNGTVRGAGSQDQHSIPAAGLRDTGRYQCEVEAAGTGLKKRTGSVSLTVREGRPKPALSLEGREGEIFEDTVTLSCSVQPYSTGWRYLWYKDRQGAPVYQTDSSSGTGAGYTISAAALSHSGEYWCGARRGRNTFYSQYSDPIWLNSEPSLCVSDICLRKTSDQDQEQSAEWIELSSRVQHTGVELE